MNPLPHALMLTAIVVMVATSGVALAILVRLYARYGTLEEDAIAQQIAGEDVPAA
jgi:multicomponent Na+:H+ antiporter subunit C